MTTKELLEYIASLLRNETVISSVKRPKQVRFKDNIIAIHINEHTGSLLIRDTQEQTHIISGRIARGDMQHG